MDYVNKGPNMTTTTETKPSQTTTFFEPKSLLNPPLMRAAYSDRTAWILAKFSQLAYNSFETDPTSLTQTLNSIGFSVIRLFNNQETQGFLAQSNEFAVLAFRGTEANKIQDIKTDLNIRFKRKKGHKLHRGFYDAYNTVNADINNALDELTVPLYITGHSLGGALATIATQQIPDHRLAACYTFGSPRVGNDEFDQTIKTPVYRVQNSADIVTRLPLNILMRYVHVGDLRFLTRKGALIRNPNMWRRFQMIVVSILCNFKSPIQDHGIEHYISKLETIALERNLS